MQEKHHELSFRVAMLWIVLFTLCVSGSAAVGFSYYRYIKKQRLQLTQYNIVAILQTTPDKERLKTTYLAELLHLSVDHPTNLFRFKAKDAKKKLLSSPLITSASVKKILPGTIFIDYTLRKPFAYLLDYSNTVVDHDAIPFPFKPFFTPKRLPEIYLGLQDAKPPIGGKQIQGIKGQLAIYLIDLIVENCCTENSYLVRVDVSNSLADSYGQKQIIVEMEDHVEKLMANGKAAMVIIPQLLRLSVDNYRQELANYLTLRPLIRKKDIDLENSDKAIRLEPIVIDLRIPQLAYVNVSI